MSSTDEDARLLLDAGLGDRAGFFLAM